MPFYEYQCKNCGHELEAMQKISDDPLKKCPHCGKSQLQRLMSAPVFRLKGGGWYETDFKDDKDKKKNLADRPDSDKPSDSDSKSESKTPETKPDATKAVEAKPAEAAPKAKTEGTGAKAAAKKSGAKPRPAKKSAAKKARKR